MKLIIAGSRDIVAAVEHVQAWVQLAESLAGEQVTEVVCGMARGMDTSGRLWAEACKIPVAEFPADWDKHGRAAGPMRNRQMAEYADGLLLVWDGKSVGSRHMKQIAEELELMIVEIKGQSLDEDDDRE